MLIGLIVVVVLLIVGSLLFLFSDRIRQISEKKNFSKKAGKRIYALARDNDFYLINQVALSIDTKVIHFDHILFTDKFIYCIGKKYFSGPISGKYDDSQWFQYDEKNHVEHIKNPMILPRVRLDYLRSALKANEDLFVSVVLLNDSCVLDEIGNCPKNNYILNLKDFKNFIQKREKADIPSINAFQLETLVQNIYKRSVKTNRIIKNEATK